MLSSFMEKIPLSLHILSSCMYLGDSYHAIHFKVHVHVLCIVLWYT